MSLDLGFDLPWRKKQMAKKKRTDTRACMVRIYGRLIIWGADTIDDVPESFREDVLKWVAENSESASI